MDDATLALLVLGLVVVLFVWNRLPVELVALGSVLAVYALGLVDVREAFAGFGDPVVPFLAALFVVSEAIDASGVTAWAGQKLTSAVGDSRTKLVAYTMTLSAMLGALISPNGAVAALLPMALATAARTRQPPSMLAMPVAFAASAGSVLAMTGTPVNLLASEAALEHTGHAFGFFEFAWVGVPLVAGTVLIVALLGPRLIPVRRPVSRPKDLSRHAKVLVEQYVLEDGLYRLRLRPVSDLVGKKRSELRLHEECDLSLVAVQSGEVVDVREDAQLAVGDVLVVRGGSDAVSELVVAHGLAVELAKRRGRIEEALFDRDLGVTEIIVPPRSGLVGMKLFPGARTPGGLIVLAVQRRGVDLGNEPTALRVGDGMLVQGTWEALLRTSDDHDVLVVDAPDLVRRQVVTMGRGAKRAIATLALMVLFLALGLVPASVAAVVAACALVGMGVVRPVQAYRAISWTAVLLVGGLIPLTEVLEETGAAERVATLVFDALGSFGPYALLAAMFLLVFALSQVLSSLATVLVVLPIAVSAASELGVSARPFLMCITIAAATSFLTPIASSANVMIMAPGAYRFGDFWKLGLPLTIWFAFVAIVVVPLIWPFG